MRGVRGAEGPGDSLEIDQVPDEWPYVNFAWGDDGSLTIRVDTDTRGPGEEITLAPKRAAKAAKKIRRYLKR